VEKTMNDKRLELMGISELHWIGCGHIMTKDNVIYDSGNAKEIRKGVAFIVGRKLAVVGYNPISNRVIYLRLAAKPLNISVVQVYAPTAEEDKEEFYHDISMALTKIPQRDFLPILGDWSAKVGQELDGNITGRWELAQEMKQGSSY
jgi:hypothetical protein